MYVSDVNQMCVKNTAGLDNHLNSSKGLPWIALSQHYRPADEKETGINLKKLKINPQPFDPEGVRKNYLWKKKVHNGHPNIRSNGTLNIFQRLPLELLFTEARKPISQTT